MCTGMTFRNQDATGLCYKHSYIDQPDVDTHIRNCFVKYL